FSGEMTSDVMASVLKSEPNYRALPPIPIWLFALIQRCFQKDPKKRWRDAGDLRVELELAGEALAETKSDSRLDSVARRRRLRALWLAPILLATVLAWLTIMQLNSKATRNEARGISDLIRFSLYPPEGTSLYAGGWTIPFALSPDGRWLAFTA